MSEQLVTSVVTVATAIIGVAIVAVLVGSNARTSQVITSAGNALANDIRAAVSPVTGGGSFGFSGVGPGYPSIG